MKRSRRERKAYEEGRAAGYAEGYKNGLYDGNPFNALIDGLRECLNVMADAVKDNPEFGYQGVAGCGNRRRRWGA